MSVSADIRYLRPELRGRGDLSYDVATRNALTYRQALEVFDGRRLYQHREGAGGADGEGRAALGARGFTLTRFVSSVHEQLLSIENKRAYTSRPAAAAAAPAAEQVQEQYMRECAEMVRRVSGARRCFALNHAVRRGGNRDVSGIGYVTAYATFAHCDYTMSIAAGAAAMLAKRGVPEAEARASRVAFFNVWQPTCDVVENHPLAVLDWRTVAPDDVHSAKLNYGLTPTKRGGGDGKLAAAAGRGKDGRARYGPPIAMPSYRPSHRWAYYPRMRRDEAIVSVQLDTRAECARHCFHSAFVDPTSRAGAPPRSSVEVRFLATFDGAAAAPGAPPAQRGGAARL